MKRISELTVMLFAAALLAGCSRETTHEIGKPDPDNGNNGERREVMLTLKNELVLKKADTKAANAQTATKADDDIATPEENAIHSLDIYVFGSATEGGVYTFQERFAYRADDSALPAGATELDLTTIDANAKETTGLLTLKKGLFVKLYCIANNTTLLDIDNNPVTEDTFVPLTFSQPGTNGITVEQEGQPIENAFQTYHTPLLDSNTAADILTTPLAMSGSYTTPLDLTDFENSTRLQIGFKLTRLAARFDIINNAAESRFTIESISMGNGRCGASFFPIRAYESTPDELITYPARTFEGVNANVGNNAQTGAFYTYPSKKDDKGYLILKGKYKVNETESTDVSYQVPFTQQAADGSSTWLEIANNHRYTIAITKADDYHLDFTLQVADWTDSGEIDDFTPGGDGKATFDIDIPTEFEKETTFDKETSTITMSILKASSSFDLLAATNAALTLQKSYIGGLSAQEYDWIEIGNPETVTTKATSATYKYPVSLKSNYTKGRYPTAILRFTNSTDGSESILYIKAFAAPQLIETKQETGSHNTFDLASSTLSLYRTTGSNGIVKLSCPDKLTVTNLPDWLSVDNGYGGGLTSLRFTLTNRDVVVSDNKYTITVKNEKQGLSTDITIALLDADVVPDFNNIGINNKWEAPADDNSLGNLKMNMLPNNNINISTASLDGVLVTIDFNGGPTWLQSEKTTRVASVNTGFQLTYIADQLDGAKPATVTLKNTSGGKDYKFTVTPVFQKPALTSAASLTLNAKADYAIPYIDITGTCPGGCEIQNVPSWITVENRTDNNASTSTTAATYSYRLKLALTEENKDIFPTNVPGDQTITLANKQETSLTTTTTVKFTEANAWADANLSNHDEYSSSYGYRASTKGKTLQAVAYSMFKAPTLENTYSSTYCRSANNGNTWLDGSKLAKTEVENNRRKYTFDIVVNASSGTDADYQFQLATLTIKYNYTSIKSYNIYRAASFYAYPAGGGSPYYAALKKGGYWWAPVNLGASNIATSGTDANGIGNQYQWGRYEATNYGSTVTNSPTSSTRPGNNNFYTSGSNNNWLNTINNNLWTSSGGNNNPCPSGYRVPTNTEMEALRSGNHRVGSLLKIDCDDNCPLIILPAAGNRGYSTGDPGSSRGQSGHYWTCTPIGNNAYYGDFNGAATALSVRADGYRSFGFSVRCIKK